jgi:hypothetical protein
LKQQTTVHVYGMEVKTQDIKDMISILKESMNPGIFIPFQIIYQSRSIKQSIITHCIQAGHCMGNQDQIYERHCFFRLENMIKDTLQIEHVIHIPIRIECKMLVSRQTFQSKRNELKANLAKWIQYLNSENLREYGSLPEVAYIRKDEYSDGERSFFSNSIRTIMSYEYDEKANLDDLFAHLSANSAANLSPGVSVPSNLSNSTYESEIMDLNKKVVS